MFAVQRAASGHARRATDQAPQIRAARLKALIKARPKGQKSPADVIGNAARKKRPRGTKQHAE
jgi:hypothetical protein